MNNANGGNIIYKFVGDASSLDSTTKNVTGGMKGMTKSMLIANLGAKVISAGFNMIRSNAGNAIKRLDTFNGYPKVLKNFGVSAKEASASINRIDKSVRGLPTSLDQAVGGVQNLFMVTKDLPEAERMFKAINDSAMVFANGSTEAVDRFSYAFKQAMSSGKVSAQDFNQMNEAIPGLMDKVAESMGMSFASLKQGLSDGSVSMDEFNNALKKLDTEGGAGMSALEKSAKSATGGIQTQLTNAKTAIVRGVASMIEAIDKGLKNAGLGGLGQVIASAGKVMESALKKLAPIIVKIIKVLSDVYKWVAKNKTLVMAIIVPIITFITVLSTLMKIINMVKMAMMLFNAVMAINPVVLIIAGIVALIAIFVLLWTKCEWFRNFWIGLWNGIKTAVIAVIDWFKNLPETIGNIVDSIINFIKNIPYYIGYAIGWIVGKLVVFVTQTIPNFINGIINWFKQLPGKIWNTLVAVVTKIIQWKNNLVNKGKEAAKGLFNAVVNGLKNLPNNLLNIGKNIAKGLWNGMSGMKSWVIDKVKSMGKGIIKGLKDALGIHSPSKEFAVIGKFSVLGYTEGLKDMRSKMEDAVQDTFGLSPQFTNSMSTHYSPNVSVTNNIDVSTDPLGQTVKKIKTFSGGAKNDYNYGMGV